LFSDIKKRKFDLSFIQNKRIYRLFEWNTISKTVYRLFAKAGFSIEIVNERPVILPKELRSADQENILLLQL
jgi:predicted metallopeptidase